MSLRQVYVQKLERIEYIAKKYSLDQTIVQDIIKLQEEVKAFKVKIPLMGGFNAGKSSLINRYIGRQVLPEEQLPETAIATELKYGAERIVAHDKNGKTRIFGLDEIRQINAHEYQFIEVFVPSERLRELGEEVVLVDMPGLDSRIEDHNKAILQYIKEGVIFLVVVDCGDGVVKSSVLDFVYELDLYGLNLGMLVNKCDKMIDENSDAVVEIIKQHTSTLTQDRVPIAKTSIHWEETPQIIEDMIHRFDKETLMEKVLGHKVNSLVEKILLALNVIYNGTSLDERAIEEKIKEVEKRTEELNQTLKREERLIQRKLSTQVKPKILSDLENVLRHNATSLASAALAGESTFTAQMNAFIRPILLSTTTDELEIVFGEMLQNISVELLNIDEIAGGIQAGMNMANITVDRLKDSIEVLDQMGENWKKFSQVFKSIVGGISIFTTLIAPWLEAIIFFLPDILRLLGIGSEKSKMEKVKAQILNEIIPNVICKLEEEIEKSLGIAKDEFMAEMIKEVENKKIQLKASLEQAIENHKIQEEKMQSFLKALEEDIHQINLI